MSLIHKVKEKDNLYRKFIMEDSGVTPIQDVIQDVDPKDVVLG